MIDPTSQAVADSEQRLPAAYSQGFAHIRVLTVINPDDPGPLGGPALDLPTASFDAAPKAPLDDLLRAD